MEKINIKKRLLQQTTRYFTNDLKRKLEKHSLSLYDGLVNVVLNPFFWGKKSLNDKVFSLKSAMNIQFQCVYKL